MSAQEDALGFHEGEALYTIAKTYPTLSLCLVEAAQNGIDADATCIFIGVDMVDRRVAVCDNGKGVSAEKFGQALQSIGKGIKSKDALGRFGRGMIAPIHIGQSMRFASIARGSRIVNEWTFEGARLRQQHRGMTIPRVELNSLPKLPSPFTHAHNDMRKACSRKQRIEWRTVLTLNGVSSDQATTAIEPDDLAHLIRTKLGHGMRRKHTVVYLMIRDTQGRITTRKIDPTDYDGEELAPAVYSCSSAGRVEFRLYRARLRNGKRQGQVVVKQTSDNYPVTMKEVRFQATGAKWYTKDPRLSEVKEGFDALCSGYFEGEVLVDGIVLDPERTKFELSDALTDLYTTIAEWYGDVAQALMNDAREEQAERRYRQLGDQSLERLMQQLQRNSSLAPLAHNLRGMLPAARTNRPEDSSKPRDVSSTLGESNRRVIVRPRQNPEVSRRSPVSTFITFAYELLRGSARLWEYDVETGVLTFNIRHPIWSKVDQTDGRHTTKHDKQVMALQEWLAFKLLLLLAKRVDPVDLEIHRMPIDWEVEYYVEMFILGK